MSCYPTVSTSEIHVLNICKTTWAYNVVYMTACSSCRRVSGQFCHHRRRGVVQFRRCHLSAADAHVVVVVSSMLSVVDISKAHNWRVDPVRLSGSASAASSSALHGRQLRPQRVRMYAGRTWRKAAGGTARRSAWKGDGADDSSKGEVSVQPAETN